MSSINLEKIEISVNNHLAIVMAQILGWELHKTRQELFAEDGDVVITEECYFYKNEFKIRKQDWQPAQCEKCAELIINELTKRGFEYYQRSLAEYHSCKFAEQEYSVDPVRAIAVCKSAAAILGYELVLENSQTGKI